MKDGGWRRDKGRGKRGYIMLTLLPYRELYALTLYHLYQKKANLGGETFGNEQTWIWLKVPPSFILLPSSSHRLFSPKSGEELKNFIGVNRINLLYYYYYIALKSKMREDCVKVVSCN